MGYTTHFSGQFDLNKKLDVKTHTFLTKFNETRRMKRNMSDNGADYGVDGEFYVDGGGDFGQAKEDTIVDYNKPPSTQPGLWCQWRPNDSGTAIEWDGGEKFYHYVEWLKYIIANLLAPKGYVLNGKVMWEGEDSDDFGIIIAENNEIFILEGRKDFQAPKKV